MLLKDLAVVIDTYTDKSGAEKKKWLTIGHLHQTNDGSREYITLEPHINLAAIPRKDGDNRVYVNLFEPKGAGGQSAQAAPKPAPAQSAGSAMDDDIPFNKIGRFAAMLA